MVENILKMNRVENFLGMKVKENILWVKCQVVKNILEIR